MRYVFFGSGEYARLVLEELLKFEPPVLTVSRPDRPKGRRRALSPTPVKEFALKVGLRVETPEDPNDEEFVSLLRRERIDFIFLADYGKILKRGLLEVPKVAPLCAHPSLLPKYRGASPIERAFFNCEEISGVTVFVMNERIDEGGIVLRESLVLDPCHRTKGEVLPEFARLGARLLYESARLLSEGKVRPVPQEGEVSYAPKIRPEEEFVRPEEGVRATVGKINGLSPTPGARFLWRRENRERVLKLLKAEPYDGSETAPVGDFLYLREKDVLLLGCSDGAARVHLIKVAGKPREFSAREFANGYLRK